MEEIINQPVATFKFDNYSVLEMSFQLHREAFTSFSNGTIEYTPTLNRTITAISDTEYELILKVEVRGDEKELPFDASVAISGVFVFDNVEDPMPIMKQNATAILYPYLRTTLAQLTTIANIPQLSLPVVNVVELFNVMEKQNEQQNNDEPSAE